MEFAKLVLLCIVSFCGFGSLIGVLSAAVCPEAFTLGRPPFFESWPVLALGALWGALDLLLPAVFAGMSLGIAANVGHLPALKASFFRRMIPGLLAIIALSSAAGGAAGWFAASGGMQIVTGMMEAKLPPERHPAFAAVWWASLGGLLSLFASAIVLAVWTWRKRTQIDRMLRENRSEAG